MSDGSGDYALAFSTAETVRRTPERRSQVAVIAELPNAALSPLFLAAIEATEEAILNALSMATTTSGYAGRTVEALPLDRVMALAQAQRLIG
jgi:D-aminopeptidase